jgi:RHS repeat-associated protein
MFVKIFFKTGFVCLFLTLLICQSNTAISQALYSLPFPQGTSVTCTRSTAHSLPNETHAYDFVSNATGTKYVTAARGGCVRKIKNNGNLCGCDISYANDANYVVIDHGDGTEALYMHLEYNSVNVTTGQTVEEGDIIGIMGGTGFTCGSGSGGCGPHVHFQVQQSPAGGCSNNGATWYSASLPISFCNVNENNGMPIGGHTYTSQNCRVQLIAPINNAQVNAANIYFSWNALANATSYSIQISTTQTFSTTVINENVGNVTSKVYSLQPNTEYFWRVKSNLTGDFDANDEVRRLLAIPAPPQLIYPTAGATNMPSSINFDWDDTQGVLNYRLQVSENPSLLLEQFNGPYVLDYPSTGTFTQSNYVWTGAQANKSYYWRVRVNTAKGTSLYAARSFATGSISGGGGGTSATTTLNYWFDNNLSVQSLPADNGSDVFLPTQSLLPGYHTANFYFKNNTGSRSSITTNSFAKVLGNIATNAMEYWYDSSFTARQTVNFTDASNIDINVSANNLSTGYHIIHYHFQLQGGLWSSVHTSSFIKNTSSTAGTKEMEYWYDGMFANRQSITVTNATNIDFNLPTTELALGEHTVYYRFKLATEEWSSIVANSFIKSTTTSGTTKMEHWFNGDFDNRVATTVTDLNNVEENISTNTLPLGTNILYTRFQKTNGLWSSITATTFLKSETGSNGWQYQYWVDSTLGLATTVPIPDPENIDFGADFNNTDTGWHILNSRFRKNNGLWSSVTADSFYKATPTFQCTITNSPTGEDSIATHFLCKYGIIDNPQDGIFNLNKILRADLAKITYRGLIGTTLPEPVTLANYLPSLFGDLQTSNANNSYYFNAAKFLSYIGYGDGITPFNPSRLNFHANDTIVRGYALKVLLEAWNIKPDAGLPNPYGDLVAGAEVNGYVLKAAQMGIIKQGAGFTNFRPYEAVTRVEAFLMLYRLLQITSKPEITDADFHIPFNRDSIVSNNPSLGEGNFSSYGETPFTIKGVPSLSFSFNYNAASTEIPDEGVRGRKANGNLIYDQQNIGVGWNHNYNNYILVDTGSTVGTSDDRFVIMWSSSNVQMYNPNTNAYTTKGVYDVLTKNAVNPTVITITTKSQVSYRFEKLAGVSTGILHLVSVKDRHNNTVSLTYENGYSADVAVTVKRLKEVDDSHNRKIEFVYLNNTNLIDSVSANAGSLHKAVSFNYVARRLVKYTNPKKDFSVYNYSSLPGQEYLITKIVMPRGNIITNKYSAGNKLTSTDLNGTQQTLIQTIATHTATNTITDINIKSISNGVTLQQSMRNNKYNMPVAATGPNYKTGMEYTDAANPLLPTKVKDSLTDVEVIPVYSSNGNLLSITKAAPVINITETMGYNPDNDIIQKTDGRNNTTTFNYNAQGQLTQINAPGGIVTKISPNTNGTVDSITNPSLIGTKFNYDAFGNLTQTKLPLSIISKAENDAYGRLLKSINPNNTGTNYLYDANDNMMQESFDTSGLNIITQYRFDKNDNLIEVENAKGNITYLTYNNNDQLIKEQFGNAIKQYEYSDDGRLKKFINPNGVNFTNQFNDKDLLVNDGYASYNYYTDNSLQSINRNGKAITYTYDALKRIIAVNYNDFAGNTVSYDYDANNNITKITYPNGIAINYEYDANNRLTIVKDNGNTPWATYDYLADGRLNTQTNRNQTVVKYFYDAAGRMDSMVTVKGDGSIIAAYGFDLDVLGNHKKEIFNQPFMQPPPEIGDSIAYTYNNTNRLLTKNTDNYSYDNNGNLTGIAKNTGAVNYNYDPKNNLLQYNEGGNTITYEYDGLGQRRSRNNTRYVLDNAYNVLVETDANGSAQYYYIHGLGIIARVKVSTGQPYYYHHDFRGSTVAITNSSQTITHKYQYGAFGQTQLVQEEDFNAYRYIGKYGVGYETKDLTFMRARYYQPSVGRFNSEDPVWATNLYPYGGNSPINKIDPKGTYIKEPNMNSDNTFSYYETIEALEKERNKAWKELYSIVKDSRRSQGSEEQRNQRKKDLVYAKQRFRNLNILKHSYEAYLKSVEAGKPDETLNPFGNTLYYMDGFGVSKIMELKNGNFVVTLLAGSMVSPSGNSKWIVTSDQIINKVNNTIEKNPNDKAQEKAYQYLNSLLNGILLNGKSFYE